MSFRLPRVYPLTDVNLSGLSHSEQIEQLAAGGATIIQLREKHKPPNEFYVEARLAVELAHRLGVQLIINDRVDIALAVGADGVHLGQDDLPVEVARALLGPERIIGVSTHSSSQAMGVLSLPVDYVAIGPIFATNSKQDTEPVLGLAGLRQVRQIVKDRPLVAIGGINETNADSVINAGADSVAVISALLTDPQTISTRTSQLLNRLIP